MAEKLKNLEKIIQNMNDEYLKICTENRDLRHENYRLKDEIKDLKTIIAEKQS